MAALGSRRLTLTLDSTDVTAMVSSAVITAGDAPSGFTSFSDALAGGSREYKLQITATQDMASASVWDKVWTAAGTDVPVVIWPNGGTTPSPTTPKFTGTVTIKEPDGALVGGDADASTTARWTIAVEFPFTSKPTKVIA